MNEMSSMPKFKGDEEQSLIETEITSEDIKREVERIQDIIDEYMNEEDPKGRISEIKEAVKAGDREAVEKLREEAVDNLKAQIDFVKAMESPELKEMENKLKAVLEYYEQKF